MIVIQPHPKVQVSAILRLRNIRHVRHVYACRTCEASSGHVLVVKTVM
jgi:hypothetical protein